METQEPSRGGRARLLAAAEELYLLRGAANVGINEVIRKAGVARMTLYNHFASKDELTAAVYGGMSDRTLALIEAAGDGPGPEVDRIAAIMALFEAAMTDPGYRGCPFIHAVLQEADAAGPIRDLVRLYKVALRDRIRRALDADRPDRGMLADQIVLLLDGAVTEGYIGAVAAPLDMAKRAAAALLHRPQRLQ